MTATSALAEKVRRAHPLARALIARMRDVEDPHILEIGIGSERNRNALCAAGLRVHSVADPRGLGAAEFDGALSTHGLLHGTMREIAEIASNASAALTPGAPFFATFGSVYDSRFGNGVPIEPGVFAPESGDEAGVAHAFFDRPQLIDLLKGASLRIDSVEETLVDAIAGAWAHRRPLRGAVHWFVRCTR